MRFNQLLALAEDFALGTGLVMADVDPGLVFELAQITREQLGTIMTGAAAQLDFLVGKGHLHHQYVELAVAVEHRSEAVIGRGITAEGKHALGGFHPVTDAGDNVIHPDHLKAALGQSDYFPRLHDFKP